MLHDLVCQVLEFLVTDLDYTQSIPSETNGINDCDFGVYIDDLPEEAASLLKDLTTPDTGIIAIESIEQKCSFFERVIRIAEDVFRQSYHKDIRTCWRRIYTDGSILLSCANAIRSAFGNIADNDWTAIIQLLDRAIVVAGAAGLGRMDLIQTFIQRIQTKCLPLRDLPLHSTISNGSPEAISIKNASKPIPSLSPPIPIHQFLSTHCDHPFILKGYIADWPAVCRWTSPQYLLEIAGRGRIVPVEIGSSYLSDGWTQQFMPWEDFLRITFQIEHSGVPAKPDSPVYLAQHSLLSQFPELRRDILLPDYVYAVPPAPSYFPEYEPPKNNEQLVINAWVGPRGTISPAHTDPYYNCYAQVVGRKTVWAAPPYLSERLSIHSASHPLANTSTIDVFSLDGFRHEQKDFVASNKDVEEIVMSSMSSVLEPGDLLFLPPKWWHAMRSEDTSASVSMWF